MKLLLIVDLYATSGYVIRHIETEIPQAEAEDLKSAALNADRQVSVRAQLVEVLGTADEELT